MNLVDSQLYRPLKLGAAFEGLIPVYKGLDYKFDRKKDNHNTYDTLRFMAQWARKYAYQMSKVAPKLKANTLQETVNNIYSFLYNHFQYKLDGAMQNLYSPSAAWHFRKIGFDCKTYSILASCILQNLNIPHSFRMIQQAGIMPGEWSHVYVIVPNGSSYYVIDATTHTNQEVSFTQKHDYTMQHRGLAAPYTGYNKFNGLGCACQGTPLKTTGLGSPAVLENTIKNFHSFLDVLETNGVSREITNRMLALVKWNVDNGIDPNMGEILKKALATTQHQGLGLIESVSSLSSMGGTYGSMNYSMPTSVSTTSTGGSTLSNIGNQALSTGMSALNNLSVGGINAGNLATNLISGNFIGAGLDVLKAVVPVDKTFGQVFANGFNLSCWGSTHTPAKTKAWAERDIPLVFNETIGKTVTQESINLYFDTMNYVTQRTRNNNGFKGCSRDALVQYADAFEAAKNKVAESFRTSPKLQEMAKAKGEWTQPFSLSYDQLKVPTVIESERFIIKPEPKPATTPTTTNNDGTEKKSGLATLVTVGSAIVLGAKLLL